jgi:hypothetical protein
MVQHIPSVRLQEPEPSGSWKLVLGVSLERALQIDSRQVQITLDTSAA